MSGCSRTRIPEGLLAGTGQRSRFRGGNVLCTAALTKVPGIHDHGRSDAGARHWRDDLYLHFGSRGDPEITGRSEAGGIAASGDRIALLLLGGYSQDKEFSFVSYDLYKHFRDNTKGFAELAAFTAGQQLFGVRRGDFRYGAGGTRPSWSPAITSLCSGFSPMRAAC
jgi:hypothetical protein